MLRKNEYNFDEIKQTFSFQIAKTLFNDECLKACPRCQHPARCQSVKGEGVCSHPDCGFQFCTSCLCTFHGSRECGSQMVASRKKDTLLPGSAQSKRNVRRLWVTRSLTVRLSNCSRTCRNYTMPTSYLSLCPCACLTIFTSFILQCFCLLCVFIECDVSQWDLVTATLFIFILPLTVHIFCLFFSNFLPEWFSKRFYIKSNFLYASHKCFYWSSISFVWCLTPSSGVNLTQPSFDFTVYYFGSIILNGSS